MDATHLHLMLTHFPIVGSIMGIGILIYGQVSKNNGIKKVALLIFMLMAILTVPVFQSGEGAEETVEHLPGVSEKIIHDHEELAETAIWVMGLLGVLSLFAFVAIKKRIKFAHTITLITLIVSIVTAGLFIRVGNLGGQIRHSEIRASSEGISTTTNEGNTEGEKEEENGEDDHDDDDDDD